MKWDRRWILNFGGKLANMALVCKDVEPAIRIRCEEMGIQIVTLKDL